MTGNQIAAIISLLLAFGVPQPTVTTVQGILQRAQTAPISAPMSLPVTQEAPISSSVPSDPTISVNGSNNITLSPDGCIVIGTKTCASASVIWDSHGIDQCGITASPSIGWAGNYGNSGGKEGIFSLGTTTVTLTCGSITTSTQVLVQ